MIPGLPALRRLDGALRREHAFVEAGDEIHFFHDYLPGKGREGGPGNALILDLKTEADAARTVRWRSRRKRLATEACAELLRAAWPADWRRHTVVVPTPPSKPRGDPNYDARLPRILNMAGLLFADCVVQVRPLDTSHTSAVRPDLRSLAQAYGVDEIFAPPSPERLIVLDDVLTTGRHFRAMDQVLRAAFPEVEIIGVFLARRVEADAEADYRSRRARGLDWGPPPDDGDES